MKFSWALAITAVATATVMLLATLLPGSGAAAASYKSAFAECSTRDNIFSATYSGRVQLSGRKVGKNIYFTKMRYFIAPKDSGRRNNTVTIFTHSGKEDRRQFVFSGLRRQSRWISKRVRIIVPDGWLLAAKFKFDKPLVDKDCLSATQRL